jgi:hypothetical protein
MALRGAVYTFGILSRSGLRPPQSRAARRARSKSIYERNFHAAPINVKRSSAFADLTPVVVRLLAVTRPRGNRPSSSKAPTANIFRVSGWCVAFSFVNWFRTHTMTNLAYPILPLGGTATVPLPRWRILYVLRRLLLYPSLQGS